MRNVLPKEVVDLGRGERGGRQGSHGRCGSPPCVVDVVVSQLVGHDSP